MVGIHDLSMEAQIRELEKEVEAKVEISSSVPNLTNPGPSAVIQDLSMEAQFKEIEKRPESRREKPGEAKTEDSSSESSLANQGPTVEIQEMSMEAQNEEIESSLANQGPTVEIQEISMEAQAEEMEAKSLPTSNLANQGPTVEIQGMSMEAQTKEREAKSSEKGQATVHREHNPRHQGDGFKRDGQRMPHLRRQRVGHPTNIRALGGGSRAGDGFPGGSVEHHTGGVQRIQQ